MATARHLSRRRRWPDGGAVRRTSPAATTATPSTSRAADGHGNVVSFIQSLFASFGAGIVAGDTGITLHNRGSGFALDARPSQPDRPAQAAAAHAGAGDDR